MQNHPDPTTPASAASPPDAKAPVSFSERQVSVILQDAARRRMLRVLAASGESLPVGEIARRAGTNPNIASKNLLLLRKHGIVTKVYHTIYRLVPALQPAPGATHLDFGEVLLRLDP